jgi:hypothetical protein
LFVELKAGKVIVFSTHYLTTLQVTRVVSAGVAKIQITVLTKGMAKFGITEELNSFAHPNII